MTSTQANPSIVTTSPPSDRLPSTNSRRPPAKRSVSLLHGSKRHPPPTKDAGATSSDSDVPKGGPPSRESGVSASDSPSSLQALGGRGSSGESSNAEKWFEKSNNEVRENSASFADNDPPFFMRNSSSSETPPELRQKVQSVAMESGANSLPLRTGLLHLGTDGSSTEDFRSVIDDLTIENKKLKRRLKKYEKLHDSHLKDEKLFEVRIHGLPPEKKRELEETLRKFASGLGPAGATVFPPNGYASLMPTMKTDKATSSQTSLHNTDSAYASMSTSGQEHLAPQSGSGQSTTPSQYPAVRKQNIHNYLHHIPEGLMPQQNPATMSERAKKKLVVRRMEQLFAGKGASAGGHQHSLQQQEVSQTAARNDRSDMEAAGQSTRQEGSREAHIMNPDGEDSNGGAKKVVPSSNDRGLKRSAKAENAGRAESSEQRPTRPLDLDPHRAQVPAENIRYMRQMGFSPQDPDAGRSPEEGHGWIYLNFLVNMAQLHTINVTADFVRKALQEYSTKLEVSHDCRRVRWKGGRSITRTSSSGEASSHDRTSNNTPDELSPRKRQKLSHNGSNVPGNGGTSMRSRAENSKYAYTPLFFHRDNSDEADDSSSEEEQDDSISSTPYPPPPLAGDSSGMTSSGIRTSSGFPIAAAKQKKQKHDDGPIIFYNNARFCTDLSGDRRGLANYNVPSYTIASAVPIGRRQSAADGIVEKRGPLANASELPEPMDIGDNPIPESMELSFPARSPPKSESSKAESDIDLEVTGIGGVWPADNFSISVQSRQARVAQPEPAGLHASIKPKAIPPRLAKLLRNTDASTTKSTVRVEERVVASKMRKLPPSALPPALNYMELGDDYDDEDDEIDDNESEALESPGALPPSAAPQPVEIHYASSSEEEDDDDDDDDDDDEDGEIDFLASARAADPEVVRRQEREYDANMAERLADEIPAGSSAATAGGGSGFASPASAANREEYRRILQEARGQGKKQTKAKASDSMANNHLKDDSSVSGSEPKGSVKS